MLYLKTSIKNIDKGAIKKKLQSTQVDKKFLLWDGNDFKEHNFTDADFEITGECEIKNGNTFVFHTTNGSCIKLLLRWKNHGGVLNPAWQISYRLPSNKQEAS